MVLPDRSIDPINLVYSIVVTLPAVLGSNLNNFPIAQTSWTVTVTCSPDCAGTNFSSDATGVTNNGDVNVVIAGASSAVFLFSTDGAGRITNWEYGINASSATSVGGGFAGSSFGSINSIDASNSTDALNDSLTTGSGHIFVDAVSGPRGIWTQSALLPPPPPPKEQMVNCLNNAWEALDNNNKTLIATVASGSNGACGRPGNYAKATNFIKVSSNSGKTSSWVSLQSVALGK